MSTDIHKKRAFRPGTTLIEVMAGMVAAIVVLLVLAMLFHSGYRAWKQTYDYANSQPQLDALETMITLGSMGRRANKMDYKMYTVAGDNFYPAAPQLDPEEVVTADAVELRYWDIELNSSLMSTSRTGTAYVLLYLDEDELKADYGPLPPGGVDESGRRRTAGDVQTIVLARNVADIEFSHTSKNMAGDGKGCIRVRMVLNDPAGRSPVTVMGASLMRNVWP